MGGDLATFRTPGRPQHGGDEPPGAVEHDDRLKTVIVEVGVSNIRKRKMSATLCTVRGGSRGSSIPAANHPATSSRRSTSRSAKSLASDDNAPPSERALNALPFTGDKPGKGSIIARMVGVVLPISASTTKTLRRSEAWATPARLC